MKKNQSWMPKGEKPLTDRVKSEQRRQFMKRSALATAGIVLGGGYTLDKGLDILQDQMMRHYMRNGSKHVPMLEHEVTYDTKSGKEVEVDRKGIAVMTQYNGQDYFFTATHVFNFRVLPMRTPFGYFNAQVDVTHRQSHQAGSDRYLEEVCADIDSDVGILKPSPNNDMPFYPLPISERKPKLGDTVYLLGDPRHRGYTMRKSMVVDVDGNDVASIMEDCVGFDKPLIPGDSGGALLNEWFELVGILNSVFVNSFGYAKPISKYLDVLRTQEK